MQIYMCIMTNVLVLFGAYVYNSLDLIDAVEDDGLLVLLTILTIYWYICWWIVFSFIYLVVGIGMLSHYLT